MRKNININSGNIINKKKFLILEKIIKFLPILCYYKDPSKRTLKALEIIIKNKLY
ncbi:unnamed protein product [marine sediment metagenome]|uniref:Uncharacterized protein n=1 Tax=marine sediment metagenome TaxID=412755 RepID=X1A738_9ZZZZ